MRQNFQAFTDFLAKSILYPGLLPELLATKKYNDLKISVEKAILPETLTVSTPEGFAYYGLHPLAYADVLQKLIPLPPRIVVIGIRTIGTTLSAVCCAAARGSGVWAERLTVRPMGHPYDRRTQFSLEQIELVGRAAAAGAAFWIVDEGPGLSGSSFISVGEALTQADVSSERITFICSHEPQVDALCARDGPQRWRRFRSIAADSPARKPEEAQIWIGSGEWRRYLHPSQQNHWPASWLSFERSKYLSASDTPDRRLFKFLGLGPYGESVFEREARVASNIFAPLPRMESHGYASYPLIDGRPMDANDLSEGVLARMAAYCAFRLQNFSAEPSSEDGLQKMAEHNLAELRFEIPVKLQMEQPVLADARMAPHEWLLTSAGQMLKTDSGSHGDDHFFPGVTDIAWDLAGAIVEWKMEQDQAKIFLEMYHQASGDNAVPRIAEFIKAYSVFRCAYCMMATNAMQGTEEQCRLERVAADYGAVLLRFTCKAKVPPDDANLDKRRIDNLLLK
ncbi:MAG TPA: hypothetical protein VG649_08360 [Candidatus Angelobacter sp.]|nr:hypothetical protein [Candidatus Angelobacter sp.]